MGAQPRLRHGLYAISFILASLPAIPGATGSDRTADEPGNRLVPAFPGAQGGGALARGGRGGTVHRVTTLADAGPGSLRACVEAAGPRVCVFAVGGHIALHSQLHIRHPYLTIAGQTAPGGGVELSPKSGTTTFFRDDLLRIETNDVVIRYLKLRMGHVARSNYANPIVIQARKQHDIVIDHCSIYWGMWDNVSIYAARGGSNKNITFSWNIIAEPLLQPGATGTVAVNVSGADASVADASADVDFHHNLFAHADHRTPLHAIATGRIVNNVIYNWNYYAVRVKGEKDIIGNYFKPGPMSRSPAREIHAWAGDNGNDTSHPPSLYLSGNAGPHNGFQPGAHDWERLTALSVSTPGIPRTDESGPEGAAPLATKFRRRSQLPPAGIAIRAEAVASLTASNGPFLATVGASRRLGCDGRWKASRDAVDARVLSEFQTGTGTANPALQHEREVGGFPRLPAGRACADGDGDGMPDAWEIANGLDPQDPSDGPALQPDGYTNLEHFLAGA